MLIHTCIHTYLQGNTRTFSRTHPYVRMHAHSYSHIDENKYALYALYIKIHITYMCMYIYIHILTIPALMKIRMLRA